MLEKRKDDSEAIGKYQGMIVSCVIASLLVWIAPMLIPVLTGQEFGTSLVTPPDILLESNETADNLNPNSIGGRMNALWDLFLCSQRNFGRLPRITETCHQKLG